MRYNKLISLLTIVLAAFSCESDSESMMGTGQGGSMTRFAIQDNSLYIVDNTSINVYDITNGNFELKNKVDAGFGIETIFAKGEFLYLGALDAMYIYSITDKHNPSFVFRYSHIASCDPVVVQGTRAYVTLRSGSVCNRGANALEIIDISNPYAPQLIQNYPMQSPHGLGVDQNLLFLCEGEHGLKVFDVSNPVDIKLITHVTDFYAYDVIARQGIAIITGEDGIFQYQYSQDGTLQLESKITVNRPVQ